MTTLRNLKPGKLLSCRIKIDSGTVPAILRKSSVQLDDSMVDFEIVVPKRYAGQGYALNAKLKVEPAEIIIKDKGYTLSD